MIFDPERFIDQLRESLAAIDHLSQPLEIANLANIIGLLLGRAISDKAAWKGIFSKGLRMELIWPAAKRVTNEPENHLFHESVWATTGH